MTRTEIIKSSLLCNRPELCDTLTDAQLRVCGLLLHGLTAEAIAKVIERSPNTARDHIKALHKKLGVTNRVQLVLLFVPAGVGA